jgi:hypothetical protein
MTNENLKLFIEAAALGVAVIGAIVALVQWRRDQSWKRAQKLDSLYKEFDENKLIQVACRVLDWSRGRFKLSDGEEFAFSTEDVAKSFIIHDGVQDLTFTPTQAKMRDAYDALLSFFERLESAISTGLVDEFYAMCLFGYWVNHFDRMPEHPNCAGLAVRYIGRYGSITTFDSLLSRLHRE